MKKFAVLLAVLALALIMSVVLVSCDGGNTTTTTGGTTTTPSTTVGGTTTKVTTTTAVTTTTPVTTVSIEAKLAEVSSLVADKNFKEEALAMMKLVIRDFYNKKGNKVLNGEGGQTTLWAVGSFLEAVASVHKLYPEDEEILDVYVGLLRKGLPQYKVSYSNKKVNGVRAYYYNASAGNQGDYYYDDDLWIAIQYIEAYEVLGEEWYLTRAQEILEFIWLGWGIWDGAEDYSNGGIPWKVGTGPTTCSNAPAAYAFARFYLASGMECYLERAETVYAWVNKYLRNGSLYKDGFGNNWSGSYNNGLMIASGSILYSITGEKIYLRNAQNTANAAYNHNFRVVKEGEKAYFAEDINNPWMDAWLIKGYIEYYKVDKNNTTKFLDRACVVMSTALGNKLPSGYFGENINSDNNTKHSTDTVILGGGVSLLAVLTEWAETYGSNYQAK